MTSDRVVMSWTASTDNRGVDHYVVRRDGVEIATTDTTTSYTDVDVQRGATYTYTVVAVDAAGNVSPASNALVVTIPTEADMTPPSAPANLTATVAGDDVTLAWTASTDDVGVARYVIERNGADVAETPGRLLRRSRTAPPAPTSTGCSPRTPPATGRRRRTPGR